MNIKSWSAYTLLNFHEKKVMSKMSLDEQSGF